MRGLLLEHGVALAQGDVAISQTIPRILEDATQPLPDMLRELIDELLGEWRHMGERINVLTGRLEAAASDDKTAKRPNGQTADDSTRYRSDYRHGTAGQTD